jgi:uncharacterized protein
MNATFLRWRVGGIRLTIDSLRAGIVALGTKEVSMGRQENEDVLRKLHEDFTGGDLEAALSNFSDDAVWRVAGNNPTAGEWRGREGLRRMFEDTMERSGGTFNPELHDIATSDEHAVFLGRAKAERGGRTLDQELSAVFHIQGGKITEVWEQYFDQAAVDAFWS